MSDQLHQSVLRAATAAELAAERSKIVLEQLAKHIEHDNARFEKLGVRVTQLRLVVASLVGLLVGAGILGAQQLAKLLVGLG